MNMKEVRSSLLDTCKCFMIRQQSNTLEKSWNDGVLGAYCVAKLSNNVLIGPE